MPLIFNPKIAGFLLGLGLVTQIPQHPSLILVTFAIALYLATPNSAEQNKQLQSRP